MISLRYYLKKLKSTASEHRRIIDAEEPAPASPLVCLPTEIILLIANALPTTSVACLALCNKRLSIILGPDVWKSLRSERANLQLAFLSLAAQDLPQYYVCHNCKRFHRVKAIEWPRHASISQGPPCTWAEPSYTPFFWSRYQIEFPQVHLAMKQRRYDGKEFEFSLAAFRYLDIEDDKAEQGLVLTTVDARIISEELLLRVQNLRIVPWSRHLDFADGKMGNSAMDKSSLDLCIHTSLGPRNDTLIPDLVKSRLEQMQNHGKSPVKTRKCAYCWMDYLLDMTDLEERGFAVIITK
ncbi:hypothetical protein MMC25_001165 [Agyrium rufum]|nr:hypothetical protein [Agyrium rufum]